MLKDLYSKAIDLSSAAAKDCRQLSKARVIDPEDVVLFGANWRPGPTGDGPGQL